MRLCRTVFKGSGNAVLCTVPAGFGALPAGFGTLPAGFGTLPAGFGTLPAGFGTLPSANEADETKVNLRSVNVSSARQSSKESARLAGW
jgi:hypothetical protein